MRECLFCDNPANTREHLWSNWILKSLDIRKASVRKVPVLLPIESAFLVHAAAIQFRQGLALEGLPALLFPERSLRENPLPRRQADGSGKLQAPERMLLQVPPNLIGRQIHAIVHRFPRWLRLLLPEQLVELL
jgi:hypothetical protein